MSQVVNLGPSSMHTCLDLPLCPRTAPAAICLTPRSSGLRYKAPSGRLELFQKVWLVVGDRLTTSSAGSICRWVSCRVGRGRPIANSMPRAHAIVRPACNEAGSLQSSQCTRPRVRNMEPSSQQWGTATPPAQCRQMHGSTPPRLAAILGGTSG